MVVLCRCGASGNKPFCDNAHKKTGFSHDGSHGEDHLHTGEAPDCRALGFVLAPKGPLLLNGEVELGDAT